MNEDESNLNREEKDFMDDIDEPNDFYDDEDFYGSSVPSEKHGDLLKELTNFEPFLRNQVAEWLGMVWNQKEGKFVNNPSSEAMMNMQGATWAINFIRTYARNNNIITHLQEDTYKDIMDDVIEVAILGIGTRCREFQIKNDADMITIYTEIIHIVQLILSGTYGANPYTEFFKDSARFGYNVNNQPQDSSKKNKGFLSRVWDKVR